MKLRKDRGTGKLMDMKSAGQRGIEKPWALSLLPRLAVTNVTYWRSCRATPQTVLHVLGAVAALALSFARVQLQTAEPVAEPKLKTNRELQSIVRALDVHTLGKLVFRAADAAM